MNYKIIWAPTAVTHFSSWIRYINKDSGQAAENERKKILKSVKRVSRFPQSGRMVPEFGHNPTLREILHGAIRILYRIRGNEIHLLTFHHSSRPLELDLFS